tara:strand:- start:85 stop:276 length:192 start_codon:yes stop_codon:yes gene_type:complete
VENLLNNSVNKVQAIIKLEIARDNLVGVSQALSDFDQPRIVKALEMIDEVLEDLVQERKRRVK